MSLALIQESAKEVRRLAIAGSTLAVGDFRLKKLIGPLEQAGAKVPVFAQVAKAIGELVNAKEAEAAGHLLHLSTLLNAILYTQGQSSVDGSSAELEMFTSSCSSTRTSARVLKPLIQALTSTGGGRYETVKSACERGTFNDLRLIDPTIQALGDNYPELADLVADKILPGYGPGIVPRLKASFDIKGKRQEARKLSVMHRLDPEGTLGLCKTALEDGSAEVKEAAIACLGQHGDCLPLVLEQSNSKNKTLRGAALRALATHDRSEINQLFIELIKGKSLELLIQPFRSMRNRQVLAALLTEGKRVFDLISKGDEEQIPRYWEILGCLAERKETETQEFVLTCFEQGDKVSKLKAAKNSHLAGADVIIHLTSLLYTAGTPKALTTILSKRGVLAPQAFGYVLRSALRSWPAAQVYDEFSPLLAEKKGAAKDKSQQLQGVLTAAHWDDNSRFNLFTYYDADPATDELLKKVEWDPRWLDAALKADLPTTVCCLARPGHKGALNYLLKLGEAKKTSDAGLLVRALSRCQYPKLTDLFLTLVSKQVKNAKYVDYELEFLFENARHLPPADLPKLEEFASKLDEKFVDPFLEALAPLRPGKPAEA